MSLSPPGRIAPALLTLLLGVGAAIAPAGEPFRIEVVDAATGRGVPLIELRTVHEVNHWTDSAGLVAFDEPGLMDRAVFFHIRGHGYEFPKDGFGFRGRRFDVRPGGAGRVEVRRVNVAERLYRVTGAGTYRDSVLLGRTPPGRSPRPRRGPRAWPTDLARDLLRGFETSFLDVAADGRLLKGFADLIALPPPATHSSLLNGQVFGQDSVLEAVFRGKIYWFWGDTNRPSYPLGTYGTPGATSELPGRGGLDPEVGVDLDYFLGRDGFVAPTADFRGEGPTWLDGLSVVPDPAAPGGERLFAAFSKVRPSMVPYRRGIAEFDAEARRFREVADVPLDAPARLSGHPFPLRMAGADYLVCGDPFPLVRVRLDPASVVRPDASEALTCLLPGSTRADPRVDRDASGRPRFAWRAGAPPVDADQLDRLVRSGHLRLDEAMVAVRDAETGRPVRLARGSTYWNEFRRRWVMIAVEQGGSTSFLGEVWYLEADSPFGPWAYARKVVTHDNYSFYNPKQHPAFSKDGGRVIFFEGTYTQTFASKPTPTPRYDYNQIMYKLDLADPRLNLPRPVFAVDGQLRFGPVPGARPAFYALDRAGPDSIPLGPAQILRAGRGDPPPGISPLYEVAAPAHFSFDPPTLDARPVGRAWRVPTSYVPPE